MLIIIISRSSLTLDHVGSKTRLLGHQATQVSDLGPLWPSCSLHLTFRSSAVDNQCVWSYFINVLYCETSKCWDR